MTFFAVRLPEGGVTHSQAFSSLMGRAALSIWHRQSIIMLCGRRNNLVNTVKKTCKVVAITIGFFRKNFNFLKQRWVRLTSCAAKVHHISTTCTNSFIKTRKSECELKTSRNTLVSFNVLSNVWVKVEDWTCFLKMPSQSHELSSLSSSMWPLLISEGKHEILKARSTSTVLMNYFVALTEIGNLFTFDLFPISSKSIFATPGL